VKKTNARKHATYGSIIPMPPAVVANQPMGFRILVPCSLEAPFSLRGIRRQTTNNPIKCVRHQAPLCMQKNYKSL
jgi:hypothetical protein